MSGWANHIKPTRGTRHFDISPFHMVMSTSHLAGNTCLVFLGRALMQKPVICNIRVNTPGLSMPAPKPAKGEVT